MTGLLATESDIGLQDDDIHAAVVRAPFGRKVRIDRMKFGVASRRQTIGRKMIARDKHFDEFRGARGGKLPIGLKLSVMDGNVIRVPFDAQHFRALGQDGSEAVRWRPRKNLAAWPNRFRRIRFRAS